MVERSIKKERLRREFENLLQLFFGAYINQLPSCFGLCLSSCVCLTGLTLLTFVYCAFDMIQLKRYIFTSQSVTVDTKDILGQYGCLRYNNRRLLLISFLTNTTSADLTRHNLCKQHIKGVEGKGEEYFRNSEHFKIASFR